MYRRFARQAARTPDAVAVVSEQGLLTYADLRDQAGRLAGLLAARGVRPGSVVGICLERCASLIPVVLGILHAGAAYLPMDPRYPRERLDYMISAATARTVVSSRGTTESVWPGSCAPVPVMEVGLAGIPAAAPPGPPAGPAKVSPQQGGGTPDGWLYVIFTSGSTGRPKAVAVPQHCLLSLFDWYAADCGMGPADVQLPTHSFSFDAGSLELLFPLMHGGRLVLAPDGDRYDPGALLDRMAAERVTVMNLVPSLLRRLLEEEDPASRMGSLRLVVCGGERLDAALCERFLRLLPRTRLVNHYGPTEATIFATSWTCAQGDAGPIPIGHPVGGIRAYVLGARLERLPPGLPGELYLGGAGVADGYQNAAALTADAFRPDPFAGPPGQRMYRTGDQAQLRLDGALEFLGRADEQVQLRGFRIELGEIETVLLRHPAVRGAAAVLRTGPAGEPLLAAYMEQDGSLSPDAVRAHLREYLPDYMVPSQLRVSGPLPRTVTGKVDKARLPEIVTEAPPSPPESSRERIIAGIWAKTLGLPSVGAADDFFALGGDSLLATRALLRVRRAFGVDLPLLAAFEHTTVGELAAVVATAEKCRS